MSSLPKHFDLRHLEIFVAVADTRSMARAAAQFGVTQAAVSQAMLRLERAAGVPLLDRRSRPFKLTGAGSVLLRRARAIIAETRIVHQTLLSQGDISTPELRLSILDSVLGALMPDLLRRLRVSVAPDNILLLSGLAERNLAALSDGLVDGVITADVDASDPDLPAIPLLRERLIIIAPPGTPPGTLEDVSKCGPYLGFIPSSALGRLIQLQLRRLRLSIMPSIVFDRSEPLVAAVADGQGWTIATPVCLLASRIDSAAVSVLPVQEHTGFRQITFMARPHEMSDLHMRTAEIVCETARAVLPDRLAAFAPWLEGHVQYPDAVMPDPSDDPSHVATADDAADAGGAAEAVAGSAMRAPPL